MEERPLPWLELLEAVFRRRRIVLSCTLAGLLAGVLIAWLTPPVYMAEARILLTAQPVSGPRVDAMSARQVAAELALLRSPALIRRVLEDLRAEQGPEQDAPLLDRVRTAGSGFLPFRREATAESDADLLERQALLLADQIGAAPIEGSNVVRVSYLSNDAEWSARFVNSLLNHHVERIANLGEQTGARSFFGSQRALLGERWREAREALSAFREEHGASLLSGDDNQLRILVSGLEAERVRTETELLELDARVGFLAEEITRYPETIAAESRVTENESVRSLKARIVELEIERSDLLSRYTQTSTLVREKDRQIEQAKALLATTEANTLSETMTAPNPAHQNLEVDLVQSRAQLTSARARLEALNAQIGGYRRQLSELEKAAAELERLENEVENARQSHQTYLRREEEARFSNALDESGIVNVSVVEAAEVPAAPEPSKTRFRLLAGALAGLLAGIALALLRDWIDPTLKGSSQAQRLSGVPVISEIPA